MRLSLLLKIFALIFISLKKKVIQIAKKDLHFTFRSKA